MFDELSTEGAEFIAPLQPIPPKSNTQELDDLVAAVLDIQRQEQLTIDERIVQQYIGQLKLPSDEAFELLDEQLKPMDFHAQFSHNEQTNQQYITIIRGRFAPTPRPWWPNALLLLLTIFSTMFAGVMIDSDVESMDELLRGGIFKGLPYALSIMLILGAHELGHYFAARYHKVAVTLPYFIPLPISLIGTMGAFIQLREPMRNRKQLFDIGVSGPIAGLIFAIPILFIGVATAEVSRLPTAADCVEGQICSYIMEGNSLLYAATKYVIHGQWLPSSLEDMTLNQLAFAGWTGLFATALNLLPVGQLDGGHVMYTLFGRRARQLYWPILIVMVLLALNNRVWIFFLLLLFFFGRFHAVPMDDITPLDPKRRALGFMILLIFVLIFVPNPITTVDLLR